MVPALLAVASTNLALAKVNMFIPLLTVLRHVPFPALLVTVNIRDVYVRLEYRREHTGAKPITVLPVPLFAKKLILITAITVLPKHVHMDVSQIIPTVRVNVKKPILTTVVIAQRLVVRKVVPVILVIARLNANLASLTTVAIVQQYLFRVMLRVLLTIQIVLPNVLLGCVTPVILNPVILASRIVIIRILVRGIQ